MRSTTLRRDPLDGPSETIIVDACQHPEGGGWLVAVDAHTGCRLGYHDRSGEPASRDAFFGLLAESFPAATAILIDHQADHRLASAALRAGLSTYRHHAARGFAAIDLRMRLDEERCPSPDGE